MRRFLQALPLITVLLALGLFTACGSSNSQARFVNTIQNTVNYGGGGLDVEFNGTKEFTNIQFPTAAASTYTSVPSGSITILGLETGTTTQVFSSSTSLSSSTQYTLVATGFAGSSGVNAPGIVSFTDNNTEPTDGTVNFRVIDASLSGPVAVDVYILPAGTVLSGSPTIPDIGAESASSYVGVPYNSTGGGFVMYVTTAGSTTPIFSQALSVGSASVGSIRTLVLTDVANGDFMNNSAIVLTDLN
jgi:hypothetical protein